VKGVSYLAPNWFWFYEAIAAAFNRALNLNVELSQSQFDPLEDPQLQQDEVDLAFICGLPLMRYQHQSAQQLQALAAPVMRSPRYQDRPVYFSDVIVHAASPITTFADLAGTTFCYNDLGSNSGYNLVRDRLMRSELPPDFFAKAIASGSHQQSMRWVAESRADCAAIDSTVLERELQQFPDLASQIRVIEAIGPCPMPPLAVAQHLEPGLIEQLRTVLLQPDAELRSAMERAAVQRFAAVETADYAAIGQIYDQAVRSGYATLG
jgi:phosphonate transport system substrate-binding protein